MSAKVPDGFLYDPYRPGYILKRPVEGGWFTTPGSLAYSLKSRGWGWDSDHDKRHGGAALVAPLTILYWDKDDA